MAEIRRADGSVTRVPLWVAAANAEYEALPIEEQTFSRYFKIQQRLQREQGRPYRYILAATRREVLERDDHTCQKCGATENLHIDHIHPVVLGGGSDIGNLQVLCAPCNLRKHAKIETRSDHGAGR